ncbi:site-specific integrase [Nisaea nitritireducens]|uniref:site-specific integrase n=1 Tax=Nisaea nitritireducens TaxID=568392 RepID=UPI00186689A9|nr:site-specific integrase [Nisaea nitritireducens]
MASIRKRQWRNADGQVTTAWSVTFVDRHGKRERKQFQTKKEADAFRVEIEGQIHSGAYRSGARNTRLQITCEQYLAYCEERMERGERMTRHNLAVYEGHIWNYICRDPERHEGRGANPRLVAFTDGIGDLSLGDLTTGTVIEFRDNLRAAGVSVTTTRRIITTLHGVLQFAIERDLIAFNPARGIKVIGRRDEASRKIVPPPKETLKALIEVADKDIRVKLAFASATGVRAGELNALRWRHVDFTKGEVTIETRVDAYGDEDVTKTTAGMRTIPLGRTVVQLLMEWKLRTKFSQKGDLVFPNRKGNFTCHDNFVKRQWYPLFEKIEEAGLSDEASPTVRFNWHSLRHFAISTWIEADLPPKTVQTFAGHSSLQVTMDRYGHLFKSDENAKVMDAIAGDLFAPVAE